jgi:hypothetical protein
MLQAPRPSAGVAAKAEAERQERARAKEREREQQQGQVAAKGAVGTVALQQQQQVRLAAHETDPPHEPGPRRRNGAEMLNKREGGGVAWSIIASLCGRRLGSAPSRCRPAAL